MMFFYSFLLPHAGFLANALYLKSKHQRPMSDYLSIMPSGMRSKLRLINLCI